MGGFVFRPALYFLGFPRAAEADANPGRQPKPRVVRIRIKDVFDSEDMTDGVHMAKPSMGRGRHRGHQHVGTTDRKFLTEDDIASEVQGKNSLQADDQKNVRNERRSAPRVAGSGGKGSDKRTAR